MPIQSSVYNVCLGKVFAKLPKIEKSKSFQELKLEKRDDPKFYVYIGVSQLHISTKKKMINSI